jgi:hypothetical protein
MSTGKFQLPGGIQANKIIDDWGFAGKSEAQTFQKGGENARHQSSMILFA